MISRYQCKIFSVKDGKSDSLNLRNLFQRASLIIFLVVSAIHIRQHPYA